MRKHLAIALMALLSLLLVDLAYSQTKESPIRVGRGVAPPRRIKTVPPSFPSGASKGGVVLELTISPTGLVDSAAVLRDIPGATDAAVAAAIQWEYEPTVVKGRRVWIKMTAIVANPWPE